MHYCVYNTISMDEKTQEPSASAVFPEAPKSRSLKNLLSIFIFLIGIFAAKALFSFFDAKFSVPKAASLPVQKSPLAKKSRTSLSKVTASSPAPVVSLPSQAAKPQEAIKPIALIEKNPLPELTLGGILAGGASGWAIIDDKIVQAGDTVKGAKVIRVGSGGVDLEFEGEPFSLLMK